MQFLSTLEQAFDNVVSFVEDMVTHDEPPDIKNALQTTTQSTKCAEFGKAIAKIPRLYGLVIGINTYNKSSPQVPVNGSRGAQASSNGSFPDVPSFTNLNGAVGDAQRFHKYLTSQLGVPEQQIKLLCDEKATRAEIIKAFQDLADESNGIYAGDSIVIFYAGHGAQVLPPKRLLSMPGCPQLVELLVPYDFNDGPREREYMGIPDYTLAALLNSIAKAKGDNITVIFDCCHSAGALRGGNRRRTPDLSQSITRAGPKLNFHVPNELDKSIWGGASVLAVLARLRHSGVASYIFFSACASFELAKEKDGRGCFTTALLNLLQAVGSSTLRCSQIIQRLEKIDGQSPQCEGLHIDRTIFHRFSASRRNKFFDVRTLGNSCVADTCLQAEGASGGRLLRIKAGSINGILPSTRAISSASSMARNFVSAKDAIDQPRVPAKVILEAGSVNGLSVGDEFAVYRSQSDDDPVGHLVIDTITPRRSYLRVRDKEFSLPSNPAPALLTRPAQPRLLMYIDRICDGDLISRIDALDLQGNIVVTSDRETAHIALSKDEDPSLLCFEVVDAELVERDLNCGRHFVDASISSEDLSAILKGLAHYYWHLKCSNHRDNSSFPVDISFYELDPHASPYYKPIDQAINLHKSGVTDLEVDAYVESDDEEEELYEGSPSKCYGLELTNRTQWDLYPTLFYFDNSKFTITSSYQPPTSKGKSEPPLNKGQSMTIGYGLGEGATVSPFTFSVSDFEAKMEVGFFKLILSTHPIDLSNVTQDMPVFDKTRGMMHRKTTADASVNWASFNILVIQRLRET